MRRSSILVVRNSKVRLLSPGMWLELVDLWFLFHSKNKSSQRSRLTSCPRNFLITSSVVMDARLYAMIIMSRVISVRSHRRIKPWAAATSWALPLDTSRIFSTVRIGTSYCVLVMCAGMPRANADLRYVNKYLKSEWDTYQVSWMRTPHQSRARRTFTCWGIFQEAGSLLSPRECARATTRPTFIELSITDITGRLLRCIRHAATVDSRGLAKSSCKDPVARLCRNWISGQEKLDNASEDF